MKHLVFGLALAMGASAFAYPKEYTADISTPEKRAALIARLWAHDEARDVRLWPVDRLSKEATKKPFKFNENELAQSNLLVDEVINPQFSFFPAPGEGVHPAVVICPGGGYAFLGWNKEGTEIARWLNDLGFSAVVLVYRTKDRLGALADAQRAMGLLRRDAAKYRIDPKRLGIIGFSAGANLTVRLATNWRERIYDRVDSADDFPCRPDFMMPIYPWDLRPKNAQGQWTGMKLLPLYPVDAQTPPAFSVQAIDDFCQVETLVTLDLALKAAGVPSETRIYPNGGHGYGRRRMGRATDTWSYEAAGWLSQFLR